MLKAGSARPSQFVSGGPAHLNQSSSDESLMHRLQLIETVHQVFETVLLTIDHQGLLVSLYGVYQKHQDDAQDESDQRTIKRHRQVTGNLIDKGLGFLAHFAGHGESARKAANGAKEAKGRNRPGEVVN